MNKMFENSKIRECRGHKEKVHTVAWNCDGRKLASGSVDKTARVWTPHRGVGILEIFVCSKEKLITLQHRQILDIRLNLKVIQIV